MCKKVNADKSEDVMFGGKVSRINMERRLQEHVFEYKWGRIFRTVTNKSIVASVIGPFGRDTSGLKLQNLTRCHSNMGRRFFCGQPTI